jgi:hypothetical protein
LVFQQESLGTIFQFTIGETDEYHKILSIAVALSLGTFILSESASAAPLDQCEILKGKNYLIELEDGNHISFGVIDFFAALDKEGVAGTENLVWTYVG